jgi:hypothetical protein
MNGLRRTAVIIGFTLAMLGALGQTPAPQEKQLAQPAAAAVVPADQQATKEQIEKLFEVLRLRKQMEQVMGMMPKLIEQSFQSQVKSINAKLPPGKRLMPQDQAALTKVMDKYMQEAMSIYPVDDMIADAVPVYQHHITRSDADAIIAFYSSAPGQRLLDEQPAIMSEYMSIVMSHMQDRSKRLTDEMEAEINQIIKPDLNDDGQSPARPE